MKPAIDNARAMSNITGMSLQDATNVSQTLSASGLTQAQQTAMMRPIAQSLDLLKFGPHPVEFDRGAQLLGGQAHVLQAYNVKDATNAYTDLVHASYASPHGAEQLTTILSRIAPQMMNTLPGGRESRQQTTIAIAAFIDRLGVGSNGATGFNQLVQYLRHPKTTAQERGLEQMGLYDPKTKQAYPQYLNQRTGAFDTVAVLKHVNEYRDAALRAGHGAAANANLSIFSTAANKAFQTTTTDQAIGLYNQAVKNIKNMPSLDAMQTQMMETLGHATQRLITDFQTLSATIADPLLKPLSSFIGALATATSNLTNFLVDHPAISKLATGVAVGGAAFGAVKLFEMIGGAGAFLHFMAHKAKEGVGGGVYIRTGHGAGDAVEGVAKRSGIARYIGDAIKDTLSLSHIRTLIGDTAKGAGNWLTGGAEGRKLLGSQLKGVGLFDNIVSGMAKLAGGSKWLAGALDFLKGNILKIGLGIIGVGAEIASGVGDVVLVIQGMQLLSAHAKDIGWLIGKIAKGIGSAITAAAKWIASSGGPMLLKAFVDLVGFIFNGVKDTIGGYFNGGHGGSWNFFRDLISSAVKSYNGNCQGV